MKPIDINDPNDFWYDLPDSRIASYPTENRDDSLLLVHRRDHALRQDHFVHLADYLPSDSHLVMNNSRVIPARLQFTKSTGARIELFCLSPVLPGNHEEALASVSECEWDCLAGNLKRFTGNMLRMDVNTGRETISLTAEKLAQSGNFLRIRFTWTQSHLTFGQILSFAGKTPLPPYIRRLPEELDAERYQTVYSKVEGSVAAPTAGLHFTPFVLEQLRKKGIQIHEITLHVGAGTFRPMKTNSVFGHDMHEEVFQVSRSFLQTLSEHGKPLIAVGTTSIRTLESVYWLGVKLIEKGSLPNGMMGLDQWEPYHLREGISLKQSFGALVNWMSKQQIHILSGSTRFMIVPGYRFQVIDTLITNFHQPGSTLLLLVAAFIGESWKTAYQYALDNNFRFLSYGDSSLLFR